MSLMGEKIKEIVDLVALVPEQLKSQCFEILLKEALEEARSSRPPASASPQNNSMGEPPQGAVTPEEEANASGNSQSEISLSELHIKARRFLEKYQVRIEQLNNLFYRENDQILPLIDDYGTTRMSEAQMRIAMFQAFRNSLTTGDFVTMVEDVREECRDRKTYDLANFSGNFKKNAALFDFDNFSKETTQLRLSEEGKKELAEFIRSLD